MPAGIHGGHKQPLSPQHHIEHHDENSTRSLATQIAFVLGIAVLLCGLCIVMGSYIKRVDISRATLYSILLHCVYGFSGVALTLGQQSLAGGGLIFAQTGLLVLPSYLGASLAFPFLFVRIRRGTRFDKAFILVAAFDLMANIFGTGSLVLAGPQIFMLAFSSITALTALIKLALLRVNQTGRQWGAIAIIVLGLLLNGEAAEKAGGQVELGAICGVLAAAGFAVCSVLAEGALTKPYAPKGQLMCAFVGLTNSSIISVYVAFYTVPRWSELVTTPVRELGGSYETLAVSYLGTTVALAAHQLCFYTLQDVSGAVACAVNKAAQTVSIFVAADLLFCTPEDDRDCFTTTKFESLVAVIIGVVCYAIATGQHEARKEDGYQRVSLVDELEDDYATVAGRASTGRGTHFELDEYN